MATNLKKWRQSASLILVAKTALSSTSKFNYDLLTLIRNKNASVLPNATVFPGGVTEKADSSRDWLKLYEKFGLKQEFLDNLFPKLNRPLIYQTNDANEIPKHISLRITAIRETFEECGILICKNIKNISEKNLSWATYLSIEDIQVWQKKVHQDPLQFIQLCSDLQIFPDLWSLYEWSNWRTPKSVKPKFDAIFFVANFQQTPPTFPDEQEIHAAQWKTPQEYLDTYREKQYFLVLPQFYEMSRLNVISDINEILKFSSERAGFGLVSYMPHIINIDSNVYFILPGDDLYPDDRSEEVQGTMEEISNSKVQHRLLITPTHGMQLIIKNFSPKCKHIVPLSSKV